ARALLHRAAALLRLFRAWATAAIVRVGIVVHFSNELYGAGGGRLVQASGDPDADLPRHKSAAAVPDRLLLAARSDPQAGAGRRLYLSVGFRDRRTRAHRPAGRKPVGGGTRLAGSVDSRGRLFRARGDIRIPRQAETGAWLTGP